MRKTLAAGLAALTFGGAVAAAAVPATADARPYHYGYGHHRHGDAAGAAIVAGIAGLALGAALSDNHPHYYSRGYYPAYRYDYSYGYGPRVCETRHWTWDPYIGRRVLVTSHYAC